MPSTADGIDNQRLLNVALFTVRLCQRCSNLRMMLLKSSCAEVSFRSFSEIYSTSQICLLCHLISQRILNVFSWLRDCSDGGHRNTSNACAFISPVRIRISRLNEPGNHGLGYILIEPLINSSKSLGKLASSSTSTPHLTSTSPLSVGHGGVKRCWYHANNMKFHEYISRYRKFPLVNSPEKKSSPNLFIFTFIRRWLRQSIDESNKSLCLPQSLRKPRSSSKYPKRLIELTSSSSPSIPPVIRLVWYRDIALKEQSMTKAATVDSSPQWVKLFPQSGPEYIALSYHLPDRQSFKTTYRNLSQRYREIPWKEIPPVFQDCIRILECLRIKYLWIDSFCIVDSDFVEWTSEVANMADIYENSVCTIALHHHNSLAPGLFTNLCHTLADNAAQVSSSPSASSSTLNPNQFFRCVNQSPLSRRAWCLQERISSQRLLHITKKNVFLEDRQAVQAVLSSPSSSTSVINASTRSPASSFTPSHSKSIFRHFNPTILDPYNLNRIARRPTLARQPFSAKRSPLLWFDLVELFSRCTLRNPRDKLLSIMGLARRIHLDLKISYYSGCWSDRLIPSLLWYPSPSTNSTPIVLDLNRAPSWSWASTDSSVNFLPNAIYLSLLPHDEALVQVESIHHGYLQFLPVSSSSSSSSISSISLSTQVPTPSSAHTSNSISSLIWLNGPATLILKVNLSVVQISAPCRCCGLCLQQTSNLTSTNPPNQFNISSFDQRLLSKRIHRLMILSQKTIGWCFADSDGVAANSLCQCQQNSCSRSCSPAPTATPLTNIVVMPVMLPYYLLLRPIDRHRFVRVGVGKIFCSVPTSPKSILLL